MLGFLLWACTPKSVAPAQYLNPIILQVDEVERDSETEVTVTLGLQNQVEKSILIDEVHLNVSGQSKTLPYMLTLPELSRQQIHLSMPVHPDLDQVRVIGRVSSSEEDVLAVCDRKIDLTGVEHHH